MNANQIVGKSAWTQSLQQSVAQAARFRSTVLITGPSGTGKELIARTIHEQSPRSAGPFVPVDCTSLSGELFASHLFGHVKGAFTGAQNERLGCFRAADQGTIFLDEIGELSAELQAKLLRTLQERVVVPVGSDQPVAVDVRIVAATNRDLAEEVRAGRFRLDLFYRLNVVAIETLPLCQRTDDIEPLALHFLEKLTAEQGFPRKQLSPSGLVALREHAWPGNVRELQNVLERVAIFATGNTIDAEAFPREKKSISQPIRISEPEPVSSAPLAWRTLAEIERQHITDTLIRTSYNQSAAAQLLHIHRASLARKIREYRIEMPQPQPGRPRKQTTPVR